MTPLTILSVSLASQIRKHLLAAQALALKVVEQAEHYAGVIIRAANRQIFGPGKSRPTSAIHTRFWFSRPAKRPTVFGRPFSFKRCLAFSFKIGVTKSMGA